mgnify:CR=1 FL=1
MLRKECAGLGTGLLRLWQEAHGLMHMGHAGPNARVNITALLFGTGSKQIGLYVQKLPRARLNQQWRQI